MIASTHLTAGAMVGVLSHRLIFKSDSVLSLTCAVVWGIVSHLLLDMIPHNEDSLYRPDGTDQYEMVILSGELGLSFLAIYFCGVSNSILQNQYLLAGMIGSALPDLPHVLMNVLRIDWKFLRIIDELNIAFHTSLHPTSFWGGVIPQVVIIIFSLTTLLFFKYQWLRATP